MAVQLHLDGLKHLNEGNLDLAKESFHLLLQSSFLADCKAKDVGGEEVRFYYPTLLNLNYVAVHITFMYLLFSCTYVNESVDLFCIIVHRLVPTKPWIAYHSNWSILA